MSPQAAMLFPIVLTTLTMTCVAEDDFYYGTGMMNELPHERGEITGGLSGMRFDITTKDRVTKDYFLQGLAQLYAGNPTEAARSFREVVTRDPDCAMGYWGIAMAYRRDSSRQVEYMWYASERRDKVRTGLERDLIDAYNEFFGTAKEPEMVLVDSETGKRRARPFYIAADEIETRRKRLAARLSRLVETYREEREILPLLLLEVPRSDLAREFMTNSPAHPLAPRLVPWHSDASFKLVHGIREPALAGAWNGIGISLANAKQAGDAGLAFEAACRLDNAWLKKWDAMPYERHGYSTHLANLQGMSGDGGIRQRIQLSLEAVPRHPQVPVKPDDSFVFRGSAGKKQTTATSEQKQFVRSLGPLWLKPPMAPDFVLPSGKGNGVKTLRDFQGPTLVVFYLGFGCIHCVEQLNELRPRYQDFKDAGIEIVAIGTDSVNDVKAAILDSIEVDGPQTPFEILCDPKADTFKAFHCWDEFTDEALHGTFLVDSKGLVRWRDISEEPFMETDFLLKESKRLLASPN